MNRHHITVSGLKVEVVRKDILNLHLAVYPPDGRIRVAAPEQVSDDAIRLAVIGKLAWIKRQRARFSSQTRQSARELVSGESHYLLGARYRLRVVHREGPPRITVKGRAFIELAVRAGTSREQRDLALQTHYRRLLKEIANDLLNKWQPLLGVEAGECRIKRMKTRWGTCSIPSRRIWLNLELAKKPVGCIEYVLVHELVHLFERTHNTRFIALMDQHLPNWRSLRNELNAAPLAHETWTY